jgi:hypothetical protein
LQDSPVIFVFPGHFTPSGFALFVAIDLKTVGVFNQLKKNQPNFIAAGEREPFNGWANYGPAFFVGTCYRHKTKTGRARTLFFSEDPIPCEKRGQVRF